MAWAVAKPGKSLLFCDNRHHGFIGQRDEQHLMSDHSIEGECNRKMGKVAMIDNSGPLTWAF
jgi:hypothetical protein